MSDDQFTRLFKYMSERFDSMERQLDRKADAEHVNRIYNAVDSAAKRLETDEQERAAMTPGYT